MVAITIAFDWRSSSKMATAKLSPSLGSVPLPNSSKSTSEEAFTSRQMAASFDICAENVERLAWIDWSSPISAKICEKNGSLAYFANNGKALCARHANSPTVFSVTVFPPVLDPVISKDRNGGLISYVLATTWSASIKGCLASFIYKCIPSSSTCATHPSLDNAYSAFANIWSNMANVSWFANKEDACSFTFCDNSNKILSISSCSLLFKDAYWLFKRNKLSGST